MDAHDPEDIAHLLTRASFVARSDDVEAARALGVDGTVDLLLAAEPGALPPEPPPTDEDPEVRYSDIAYAAWVLELLSTSTSPLLERLTWFLHGHFATGVHKVEFPSLMHRQFVMLRTHALGDLDALLRAVTIDPAMMLWLDLHLNTARHPNENYARELLELFTLGVEGGYSQGDVVDVARALTGWDLDFGDDSERPTGSYFDPERHDPGLKSVLGVSGSHDLDDIVAVLASSPQCHRHFARRLWRSFAGTPIDGTVEADIASAIGTSGSLREGVRTMLTHPRFYDADVKVGLVATPVEVLVRTCRGFGLDPARWSLEGDSEEEPPLGWSAQLMGQVPGAPPTVAGWPHNEAWLDARHSAGRALVGRDLAERIVSATTPQTTDLHAAARSDVTDALGAGFGVRRWSTTTARAIDQAAALEDHDDALVTATFIAFCSPEVALS